MATDYERGYFQGRMDMEKHVKRYKEYLELIECQVTASQVILDLVKEALETNKNAFEEDSEET